MNSIHRMTLLASVCALELACAADGSNSSVETDPDPALVQHAALSAELEGKFNTYTQALLERNTQQLQTLMSSEIRERIDATGMDVGSFADKMLKSMLTQFTNFPTDAGFGAAFMVESVAVDGDAARVELSYNGEKLSKPFYFVKEAGDYKLNLRRQGFTRPQPEGSGASVDTYRVRNDNPWETLVRCSGDGGMLAGGSEIGMRCQSKCGFFTGTRFYSPLNSSTIKCDWNTWGTDVYYDDRFRNGLICNDEC